MRIAFAVLLSLLLAGRAAEAAAPYDALPGTAWVAIDWKDRKIDPTAPPRLAFGAANQISGFGGCNWFQGSYAVNGDRIVLDARSWTKKFCADRPLADSQVGADLKRVVRLAIGADGVLAAHAEDGAAIFRFRRAAPGEGAR